MKKVGTTLLLFLILLMVPSSALAQTYLFSLDKLDANVFVNQDGTVSIDYVFIFTNSPSASPLDFVDVGLPASGFDESSITAEVDNTPVGVSRSDYQGSGSGIAVVMGSQAIQPGSSGSVHVTIPRVNPWLREDSKDKNYASFVFSPTWFGKQYMTGTTDTTVAIHFPPGVQPAEPRWHSAPDGFPSEPTTGLDDQERVTYTWHNPQSSGYEQNNFGVSFPAQYVPTSAITHPSFWETIGISEESFFTTLCCVGFFGLIIAAGWLSKSSTKRRKLQYMSPKIAIEGMGIKRGLTAVEAAILMEQPLDKVLTMILFSVVKKNAATVTNRDPLTLQVSDPLPQDLNQYETDFINAFKKPDGHERRAALQAMTIDLVKSTSNKMKGFSRKETIDYYRDIIERAWGQVEAAQTPEVKSGKYDEVMEWTMLDKDYDDRTRRVFTGPVFVPIWWGRFDPTFSRPAVTGAPKPMAAPVPSTMGGGKGGISLPTLPGAIFAASMVNSVQTFSSKVIGNITDFTSNVTKKTNPVPVVSSSGKSWSGGGHSCACACACAGCACACAGGGR